MPKLKMNSINPFDDLYNVEEIEQYFGLNSITAARGKLEIIYWDMIVKILHGGGHIQGRTVRPSELNQILAAIDTLKYSNLEFHLKRTHHEIKALEYTIREMLEQYMIPATELIHWGLTSQDIVDPVYTIAIRDCTKNEIIPSVEKLLNNISIFMGKVTDDSVFPARTHGQLAVPTTMCKEIGVYYYRLNNALTHLAVSHNELRVKFGGAVGGLAVHKFVDSGMDWRAEFQRMFMVHWKIKVHSHTTQVNGNDDKARVFADLININNILIDLCQDMWNYFSYGYIGIKRDKDHVGSSTMAQKNNPIEFENVEGMLQLANSELHFMMDKLTRSRGQRDLSDSVVQRFYGLMFAKVLHAYKKLTNAITKIEFKNDVGRNDVEQNSQIFAELLQSYSKLKGFDRFEEIKWAFIDKKLSMNDFVEIVSSKFPDFDIDRLRKML